jgi:hypothetical protein
MFFVVSVLASGSAWALPVDVHYEGSAFSMTAPAYEFRFELAGARMTEFRLVKDGKVGENVLDGEMELRLNSGGVTYRSSLSKKPAHLHPIRIGRYLTEFTVENIIPIDRDGKEWPGLGGINFVCHPNKVYVNAALISSDQEWVKSDLVVYQAYEGHRDCPDAEVESAGIGMSAKTDTGLWMLREGKLGEAGSVQMDPGKWVKGSRHGASFVLLPGSRGKAERVLEEELNPLPASAFECSRGKSLGYDHRKGVYAFYAKDTPTPEPPRNWYGGCTFTVTNDDRPRRILIEQLNDWGGLRGAVIRDGEGNPLPVQPQICANFPELGRHGEPDWGFVIYLLELAPGEKKSITADHLYHGYGKHDQIVLMSLENVGNPVLMQTSVATVESHTMTTGLYFKNPDAPHNDLRLNDFRMYKGDYGGNRSVSAVLPSFFRYLDSSGKWHKVVPEHVEIAFEGPVLADYTSTGRTDDGKVSVTVRTIQMPHSDITRVFNHVAVEFLSDVSLDPSGKSNIRFAQHFTFNPMVFRKYAYTSATGSVSIGELDLSGEIKEDGTPLGDTPFVCAYYAPNPLERGIPCGDITGNPGFVLLDWKAKINGNRILPGLYVFPSRGLGDGGDYSRDLAVVPTEQLSEIKAGSRVEYLVENFVWGDVKSDYSVPALERVAFGLNAPTLDVTVGKRVAGFPPTVRASGEIAEFRLTGGRNKLAVKVEGFTSPAPIGLYERFGVDFRPVNQGVHGNDWYQCYPDARGAFGFMFLIEPGKTYRVTQEPLTATRMRELNAMRATSLAA